MYMNDDEGNEVSSQNFHESPVQNGEFFNHNLNSTHIAATDNGEAVRVVGDKSAISSIPVDKQSLNNTSVGVRSLFDSTNQKHYEKEMEFNQGFLEINPSTRNVFIHMLEKMESLDNNILSINEQLQSEKIYNKILKDELQTIKKEMRNLNNKNDEVIKDIDEIMDELYIMDCKIIENNQYTRRESIVISGIPDNIPQDHLEETVIGVLRTFGLHSLSSYHISACHRLWKNKNDRFPARTIVRFTNRKVVAFCLKNRDRLLEIKNEIKMNLRIYESLCDSNEKVYKDCFNLKKYGIIKDYFLRNGFVKIVFADGNRVVKIKHPEDLYHFFKDYYDCEDLYN